MWKINRTILVMILLFTVLWGAPLLADDTVNTCFIQAPEQNDVWVIVYEANKDGERGKIIFKDKIPAGHKVKITSSTGQIRYNYTHTEGGGYQGDVDSDCTQENTVSIF